MAVTAVVFDWGGTLSEFVAAELVDAWRLVARHLDPDREDEITARLVGVEQDFWETTYTHQRSATLADLLAAATRDLGIDAAEALLEEAAVRHLDAWTPHLRHDPEAAGVLEALRDRGIARGLLSNTHWPPAFHERFLERDGLAELLDARLYTSTMEFQKPHASAFRAALDALGVDDPTTSVFVGDRAYDDVYGAQQLGMKTVLRPNPDLPEYDVKPDAVITRLPELLPLIDSW